MFPEIDYGVSCFEVVCEVRAALREPFKKKSVNFIYILSKKINFSVNLKLNLRKKYIFSVNLIFITLKAKFCHSIKNNKKFINCVPKNKKRYA